MKISFKPETAVVVKGFTLIMIWTVLVILNVNERKLNYGTRT